MNRLPLQLTASILLLLAINAAQTQTKSNAGRILRFLQSIPTTAKDEMDAILKNTTLTKGQIEQKLDAWAQKQPGDFPAIQFDLFLKT